MKLSALIFLACMVVSLNCYGNNVIELPGLILVEFEPYSFSKPQEVSIKHVCDYRENYTTDMLDVYEEHKIMSSGGPAYPCFFAIRTVQKPLKPVLIKIKAPSEFLSTLNKDYYPVIFTAIVQHGTDSETIDDVEPLEGKYNPDTGEVSSEIPIYGFTSDYAWKWERGINEAFIILGSVDMSQGIRRRVDPVPLIK